MSFSLSSLIVKFEKFTYRGLEIIIDINFIYQKQPNCKLMKLKYNFYTIFFKTKTFS